MILYIAVTILVLALSLWVRPRTAVKTNSVIYSSALSRQDALSRICLCAIFATLFIPEALRVNTGNDYAKYVDFMHNIGISAYDYVATEFGFNALVKLIYSASGFENYLLVFAVFAALTAGLFLLAMRQQADNFTFTFFLFMMFGYYFQSYNTVRYYFALALTVVSIKYLQDRRYGYFVLLILLAATFHKSVLIVLVLYPLALVPWKKIHVAAAYTLGLAVLLTKDFWMKVVVKLYPSYEGTQFLSGGYSAISWTNIARCCAVIILAIYVWRRRAKAGLPTIAGGGVRGRFYLFCNIEALGIYIFCSFIPFISRIGYYLTVTQIFFIPALLGCMPDSTKKERREKKIITGLVILAAVIYFIALLRKMPDDTIKILPYKSFLFSDMPAIWSDVNR